MNQLEHPSGLLDCLGQMWTWVGGVGEDVATATLVDRWANVLTLQADSPERYTMRLEEHR